MIINLRRRHHGKNTRLEEQDPEGTQSRGEVPHREGKPHGKAGEVEEVDEEEEVAMATLGDVLGTMVNAGEIYIQNSWFVGDGDLSARTGRVSALAKVLGKQDLG